MVYVHDVLLRLMAVMVVFVLHASARAIAPASPMLLSVVDVRVMCDGVVRWCLCMTYRKGRWW